MKISAVQAIALGFFALACCPVQSTFNYLNGYGEDVVFDCPTGQALSGIASSRVSEPDLEKRKVGGIDRQWKFYCTPVSKYAKEYCDDYNVTNEAEDTLMLYQCPSNSYIGGVRSMFTGTDRVWEVKCCRTLGECTRNCGLYGPINDLDEPFYYEYPPYFFVGLFSTFDADTDDRQYYVEQCIASTCGSIALHKHIWTK